MGSEVFWVKKFHICTVENRLLGASGTLTTLLPFSSRTASYFPLLAACGLQVSLTASLDSFFPGRCFVHCSVLWFFPMKLGDLDFWQYYMRCYTMMSTKQINLWLWSPWCAYPLHWLDNFGASPLRHKPSPAIFSPHLCDQLLSCDCFSNDFCCGLFYTPLCPCQRLICAIWYLVLQGLL